MQWTGKGISPQVPEVFSGVTSASTRRSPKTLINQFGRLSICTRTPRGRISARRSPEPNTYQQGFVVEDPALFWDGDPRETSLYPSPSLAMA